MRPQGNHKDREISPITEKRFRRAYSHTFYSPWTGAICVNMWTDSFCIIPKIITQRTVPWWEFELSGCKTVNIIRVYWLKFGIAFIQPANKE